MILDVPEGYDQKVLRFQKSNAVNVQEKLKMGAFSNRVVLFDPFTCYYEVKTNDTDQTQDSLKTGAKELSLSKSRNKEFDIFTSFRINTFFNYLMSVSSSCCGNILYLTVIV